MRSLRALNDLLKRTPLHPQWLLAGRDARAEADLAGLAGRVLDIGCADRWLARRLSAACEYVGLDYPPTGGILYRARPDVFGDAARLPFAEASFDAVVMLEVLEHLAEPALALREIARVLRPRGVLVLSMPFLYPIHDAPFDFQRYTRHGLERALGEAGLAPVRIDRVGTAILGAGLLLSLALGGAAWQAVRARRAGLLWLPLLAFSILVVNLGAWLGSQLLPDWSAMSQGYWICAQRADRLAASAPGGAGNA